MSDNKQVKLGELDQIGRDYETTVDFDHYLIEFKHRSIKQHLAGTRGLEMGCASVVMTKLFLEHPDDPIGVLRQVKNWSRLL